MSETEQGQWKMWPFSTGFMVGDDHHQPIAFGYEHEARIVQSLLNDLQAALTAMEHDRDGWKQATEDAQRSYKAQLMAANEQVEAAETQLHALRQMAIDMDMQATELSGDPEGTWVRGYMFNTGSWHRFLGWAKGAAVPAYALQEAQSLRAELALLRPRAALADEAAP